MCCKANGDRRRFPFFTYGRVGSALWELSVRIEDGCDSCHAEGLDSKAKMFTRKATEPAMPCESIGSAGIGEQKT